MVATLVQQKRYSLDEYFALEERAEERHEYHNGKIITMAGGSIPHNQVKANIMRCIGNWIEDNNLNLFVFDSDTKIRIEKINRNVYPDAVLVCERPVYWNGRTDIIVNPTLIFEVLSDSTNDFDKKDKFTFYKTLPSFREYVLIDQYKPWVDVYFKQDLQKNIWEIKLQEDMESSVRLHSIGLDLPMAKIYWQIPELQGGLWEGA